MKNRASRVLKVFIADLRSMAKSKTLALKSRTNAIRTRLIILSLVMNKKFVISSISHKFQSVLGHHPNPKEECLLEDSSDKNNAMMVFNDNNDNNTVSNPSETQVVEEDKDQDGYESYYKYEEDYDYDDEGGDDKCMYLDLTHTVFDKENLDLGGSVIELVKSSKEESGKEFKMEEEIDHMADLFIKKFHRQIMLQKQNSLKRCKGMC
ncbi:hypothetical protein TanjilG_05256 [Lupinus angustifolius]|uniref:Uncharacterized protein n=1 Tax=Lupinus angustifolius TaxID=3871 RepID=A0A4P1RB40_LUPAN|nr:PREDICTED: uncharacterized protein LOC109353367 [Lupinus angustifolius]OIW06485.1 hypothetical protein TanjilG_05256 [Lupinus angustifolius]